VTGPRSSSGRWARSVAREIDQWLSRLHNYEKALAAERERLLSVRAAVTDEAQPELTRTRRLSQGQVAAYMAQHPGCSPPQIAAALRALPTNVSVHSYRGRNTRYERREDGWYLRVPS
jgi:hypothetical protein